MNKIRCRFCEHTLTDVVVDLGMSPIANDYIDVEKKLAMEPFYPLQVYICNHCYLVQLPSTKQEHEIFTNEYAYFSSYSQSWLDHAKKYTHQMITGFDINSSQLVVELASNDGYLLQYFKEKKIPILGIEPAANVAAVAQAKGIPTLVTFFGLDVAKKLVAEGKSADLIIGNNVLAHVPDLNDFVAGMKFLLKPEGLITLEFPHLQQLIDHHQFDTIYHEHFSYFSLLSIEKIFARHRLIVFRVDQIPTHGGSLRIYVQHVTNKNRLVTQSVNKLRQQEKQAGLDQLATYQQFADKVKATKRSFLDFLITAKHQGKKIVGYGAPAKGNTFLNYCGVRGDFLDYTVDLNPHKQDKLLPGVHIPILSPEVIKKTKPDYVVILPWNLQAEIKQQLAFINDWGGQLVVAIPETRFL